MAEVAKAIMEDVVILNDDLFYGKGTHKKCYRHPKDKSKCIKMAYSAYGQKDLDRELKYLKILSTQGGDYSVLPKYYGTVATNLGQGHVYELIEDYDGSQCITLEELCMEEQLLTKNYEFVKEKLLELKGALESNNIITMGIFACNIMFQEVSRKKYAVRIVNDMGSAAFFPFEYYFGFIAKIRIRKRWQRFLKHLECNYGKSNMVLKLIEDIR